MKTRLPWLVLSLLLVACSEEEPLDVAVEGHPGARKSSPAVRAARRAYDGAPPVIPHAPFGASCATCHTPRGMAVTGVGFAPAHPHADTPGMSSSSACTQCHVFRNTDELFVETTFAGLEPALAERASEVAPPVMPHRAFMHEDCLACHAGPAVREEIRTTHPERAHCRQCHVEAAGSTSFAR